MIRITMKLVTFQWAWPINRNGGHATQQNDKIKQGPGRPCCRPCEQIEDLTALTSFSNNHARLVTSARA